MKVLVTGADGFVGQHMTRALLERGHEVTALDMGNGLEFHSGVMRHTLDLRDLAALGDLPRNWDGVIHLAGASIPSCFSTTVPVLLNLEITLNLLNHLRDSRVLLVSSCHVYAPAQTQRQESDPIKPQGLYGLSKHLVEQMATHFQGRLDIRIARPFNHLGPGLRPELMVPSLLRRLSALGADDEAPVGMDGLNSIRDFIDVRDVATAYLAILEAAPQQHAIFNVCTGQGHTIEEVVAAALALLGQRRPICFKERPNSSDDIPYLVGDASL
ncbi:MAG: NAD-dependent epimerase/dehydratase family protein, partial [Ilumatobacteraceae bacterium]|nr:NAD-dependent epimerase/dehydratase family protein [Ilumatobacteraceae bacterium]